MPESVALHKRTLRAELRAILRGMPASSRERQSGLIQAWLAPWVATGVILAFAPLPEEVDLWPMLASLASSGRLVLPRVCGTHTLSLHRVHRLDLLREGAMRLREPPADTPEVSPELVDVVLVPGLAFTPEGARLGRGGGMFDRLLACLGAHVVTIGVGFSEQRLTSLPCEPHDVPCRVVVPDFGMSPAG